MKVHIRIEHKGDDEAHHHFPDAHEEEGHLVMDVEIAELTPTQYSYIIAREHTVQLIAPNATLPADISNNQPAEPH